MNALLPADKTYWRFSGLLTTPPCTEGVTWIVMKHQLTLSAERLDQFTSVIYHDKAAVQPLHGRLVVD